MLRQMLRLWIPLIQVAGQYGWRYVVLYSKCIYRAAQEAVANAAHHANAHTLTVELSVDEPGVRLLVRDDGLGRG